MKMKKCLSLVLAFALILSLAVPALAVEKPWYAEAQSYVEINGLMKGTDKGFEPNGTVSLATVLQTLYNLEGNPAV